MTRSALPLLSFAALAAACTPHYASLKDRAAAEGTCREAPAQEFVGQEATAALAQRVLDASGARVFEWIAPDMIVTTAFNPWRIRVTYDERTIVRQVSCG